MRPRTRLPPLQPDQPGLLGQEPDLERLLRRELIGSHPRAASLYRPDLGFGRVASAPRNAGRQDTEAARSSLAYYAFIRLRHWPHRTPRPAGSSTRRASTGGGPLRVLGVWVAPWLRQPSSLPK